MKKQLWIVLLLTTGLLLAAAPVFSANPLPGSTGAKPVGSSAAATSALRLEADALRIIRCTEGKATASKLAADGYAAPKAFSEDRVLHWRNAEKTGALLELAIAVEKKGRYGLSLQLAKYRTFGQFQVLINGKPVGAPVDLFGFPEKDEVVPYHVNLGDVTLQAGENRLALKLTGTNPKTVMPDHGVVIDWIELAFKETPVPTDVGSAAIGAPTGSARIIEADALRILRCTSGEARVAKLAEDGSAEKGAFTGDRSLQWHDAAQRGATLELALPPLVKGRYAIKARVAKYRTYGIHQFLINGAPLGNPVDMFGNPGHDIVTAFTVNLGEADLNEGANKLGLRLVSTNPNTIMANHGAGLDWISLTPVAPAGKMSKKK